MKSYTKHNVSSLSLHCPTSSQPTNKRHTPCRDLSTTVRYTKQVIAAVAICIINRVGTHSSYLFVN